MFLISVSFVAVIKFTVAATVLMLLVLLIYLLLLSVVILTVLGLFVFEFTLFLNTFLMCIVIGRY